MRKLLLLVVLLTTFIISSQAQYHEELETEKLTVFPNTLGAVEQAGTFKVGTDNFLYISDGTQWNKIPKGQVETLIDNLTIGKRADGSIVSIDNIRPYTSDAQFRGDYVGVAYAEDGDPTIYMESYNTGKAKEFMVLSDYNNEGIIATYQAGTSIYEAGSSTTQGKRMYRVISFKYYSGEDGLSYDRSTHPVDVQVTDATEYIPDLQILPTDLESDAYVPMFLISYIMPAPGADIPTGSVRLVNLFRKYQFKEFDGGTIRYNDWGTIRASQGLDECYFSKGAFVLNEPTFSVTLSGAALLNYTSDIPVKLLSYGATTTVHDYTINRSTNFQSQLNRPGINYGITTVVIDTRGQVETKNFFTTQHTVTPNWYSVMNTLDGRENVPLFTLVYSYSNGVIDSKSLKIYNWVTQGLQDAGGGGASHDPVTVSGKTYATLTDQHLTLNDINLSTDVTNILGTSHGGTGSSTKNFVDLSSSQTVRGMKNFYSWLRANDGAQISNSVSTSSDPILSLRNTYSTPGRNVNFIQSAKNSSSQYVNTAIFQSRLITYDDGSENSLAKILVLNNGATNSYVFNPDGTFTTPGLLISTNPGTGKVLTSDQFGNATWQDASGGGGTLQSVTEAGATTNQNVTFNGQVEVLYASDNSPKYQVNISNEDETEFSNLVINHTKTTITTESEDDYNQLIIHPDKTTFRTSILELGTGSPGSDKILYANNGDTYRPYFKYDESENAWKFSNDGQTSVSLGGGGSAGTLQSVTDGGATTTNALTLSGGLNIANDLRAYTGNAVKGCIRLIEQSPGAAYTLGGYICSNGVNNSVTIGVHNAFDQNPSNDKDCIIMPRSGATVELYANTVKRFETNYSGAEIFGRTVTDDLTIQTGAGAGKVWTCSDANGVGSWQDASGGSQFNEAWQTPSGAAPTIDLSQGINLEMTFTSATAITFNNAQDGMQGIMIIHQDATGGRDIIFNDPHKVINGGNGQVQLTQTGTATDIITWVYRNGTFYINTGNNYN